MTVLLPYRSRQRGCNLSQLQKGVGFLEYKPLLCPCWLTVRIVLQYVGQHGTTVHLGSLGLGAWVGSCEPLVFGFISKSFECMY